MNEIQLNICGENRKDFSVLCSNIDSFFFFSTGKEGTMSDTIARTHKNTLFQLAFKDDKVAALSLYNAVNRSNHRDASKLQFALLDKGFYLRMENDAGFLLDQSLNLYEHQSTINLNMPLRGLFYFADLYRQMIPKHSVLYQKKRIVIPAPKYLVFYNGKENMGGAVKELRLSDSFDSLEKVQGFEWTATMININPGYNEDLLNSCETLRDYCDFVKLVRELSVTKEQKDAITEATEIFLNQERFVRVLTTYKEDLLMQTFWEFDEEEYVEYIKEETRAEMQAELDKSRAETAQAKTEAEKAKTEVEKAKAREKELLDRIKELENQ